MNPSLAILVPTCCDDPGRLHLGHTLASIAMQKIPVDRIQVIVRDEGQYPAIDARDVRLIMDLLDRKSISPCYVRTVNRKGIAEARRDLISRVHGGVSMILFIDDDMILEPGCIAKLIEVHQQHPEAGFAQGAKIEIDSKRYYWNDINTVSEPHDGNPHETVFGDAALLLIPSDALELVDWNVVSKFSCEGLAGEDIVMTLMIADTRPGLGVPRARGWHLSPARERWRWEPANDLMNVHLLKDIVSPSTLITALPHLKNEIISLTATGADSDD